MTRDTIGIIEAAYDLRLDEQNWLHRVSSRIGDEFAGTLGVLAHYFEQKTLKASICGSMLGVGITPTLFKQCVQMSAEAPEEHLASVYDPMGRSVCRPAMEFYATSAERSSKSRGLNFAPAYPHLGITDLLGLFCFLEDGSGCMISPLLTRPANLPAKTKGRWSKIACHVAAGLRLRRRFSAPPGDTRTIPGAVIFSRQGEQLGESYADVDRIQRLRNEVRTIVEMRTTHQRFDRNRALERWNGLLAGTYSLIDYFGQDGLQCIVALENPPDFRDGRALSQQQRSIIHLSARGHSVKEIAYELGLRVGSRTVETHLRRAMEKLGVASRAELVKLIRGLEGGGGDGLDARVGQNTRTEIVCIDELALAQNRARTDGTGTNEMV